MIMVKDDEFDDQGLRFSRELHKFIAEFVNSCPEENAITMCTIIGSLQLEILVIFRNTQTQMLQQAQLQAVIPK